MRVRLSFLTVLLFVFLFSCANDENNNTVQESFDSGDYNSVIRDADDILSSSLDSDALFYRTLSYYRLGKTRNAEQGSYFYLLIFDEDDAHYYSAAEILLRTTGDPEKALYAGDILSNAGRLNRVDYLPYYHALLKTGNEDRADRFYYAITPGLSAFDLALMNIRAEASSDRIVSSLETLYEDSGLTGNFTRLMSEAIPLLISRREGQMLLNLVSYGYADDPAYALLIGDLMLSLGRRDEASEYWRFASKDYPVQADIRFRSLNALSP